MKIIHTQIYTSPCGDLFLGSLEGKLCICDWVEGKNHQVTINRLQNTLNARCSDTSSETTIEAVRQLEEYFQRKRKTFNIPLLIIGSEFQQKVWEALLSVPYGETRSYGWQAAWIGNPKAVRAVGTANGANPISIFLPCHRIIGNNHQLTGYGGGLEVKRYLLELESPLLI